MEASTPVNPLQQAAPGSDSRADSQPIAGALPNLIVIGAQKCGTSVLHYYLGLHPEVSMSKPKELNFFIDERAWPRGVDWYRGHFDPDGRVRGESSPNYTAFPQHQGVPERMHSVVAGAKLIYMIRDPLERIAAHWVHNYAKRREKGTLADTLTHPNTSYVTRSLYAMQLERFLAFYSKEQVLVIQQSELRYERAETLHRVFDFLGVDPDFDHPRFSQERHQTSGKTRATRLAVRLERLGRSRRGRMFPANFWLVLDDRLPLRRQIKRPDVRAALPPQTLAQLRADGERLRELTGRDFSNWKVWHS
ncbi:MAG: sulfotransferase [Solirubrobacterales bacterium]|nr:sulfotransferase [Solirubrobacterales bacterium]